MLVSILVLWFLVTGLVILFYARQELAGMWQEPVLSRPVMIVESDDWGSGPASQADVLEKILGVLGRVTDGDGRTPVMTLGVILAAPDSEKISVDGGYYRLVISRETHWKMLEVINRGVDAGVFSLQLHGLEHYWPPALMAVSRKDENVRDWLYGGASGFTESLPSPLQSRWVNASVLPSRRLEDEETGSAAREEVAVFQAVFGARPLVAVPPTFIWNKVVERAWAEAGIEVVVTPGRSLEVRDATGKPAGSGKPVFNMQPGEKGIVYMVRDCYFEPALGHSAGKALADCASRTRLGRPALYETHRFNFIGPKASLSQTLAELEELLSGAVKQFPGIAFMSTARLAAVMKDRHPEWVEQGFRRRLHVWISRLGEMHRLRKLVLLTGWVVPVWLVWKLTQ